MEWLKFSNLAIGSLPTMILLWVLTIFLLTLKRKSMATWMLFVYFLVLSILLLSYVIRYSVLSTFAFNTGQVSNVIVFGIVAYVLFAYYFQENYHLWESKIAAILFSLAALYVYIMNFVRYPMLEKTFDFQAHYFTYVFGPRISFVTGLGYVWIMVVFFRKTIRASKYVGSLKGRHLGSCMLIVLVKMVCPRGKKAKSFQALALLTIGMFAISFFYLLVSAELIKRVTYGFLFNTIGLITTFAIFIVYTSSTFEPSSFRWKLIGLSLAPTMLILGIVSSVSLSLTDQSFDHERKMELELIKSTLVAQKPLELPLNIEYIASRPSRGDSNATTYVLEQTRREGLQVKNFVESDRREKEKQFSMKKSGFPIGTTFLSERAHKGLSTHTDRRAPPELERRFRYFDLIDIESFYIHYDIIHGDRLYEIGYRYVWYREKMHTTAVKLFYIIVVTTVILLVLFPIFFYWNIFKIDLRIY